MSVKTLAIENILVSVIGNVNELRVGQFNVVGLGGTFDRSLHHEGHRQLLRVACLLGKHVIIGLTDERLHEKKRHARHILSFNERQRDLKKLMHEIQKERAESSFPSINVIKISSVSGSATTMKELNMIVLGDEPKIHENAHGINDERVKNGLSSLIMVLVPLIVDRGGNKISSSTIRDDIVSRNV